MAYEINDKVKMGKLEGIVINPELDGQVDVQFAAFKLRCKVAELILIEKAVSNEREVKPLTAEQQAHLEMAYAPNMPVLANVTVAPVSEEHSQLETLMRENGMDIYAENLNDWQLVSILNDELTSGEVIFINTCGQNGHAAHPIMKHLIEGYSRRLNSLGRFVYNHMPSMA